MVYFAVSGFNASQKGRRFLSLFVEFWSHLYICLAAHIQTRKHHMSQKTTVYFKWKLRTLIVDTATVYTCLTLFYRFHQQVSFKATLHSGQPISLALDDIFFSKEYCEVIPNDGGKGSLAVINDNR